MTVYEDCGSKEDGSDFIIELVIESDKAIASRNC
jgi:hypothetical protein